MSFSFVSPVKVVRLISLTVLIASNSGCGLNEAKKDAGGTQGAGEANVLQSAQVDSSENAYSSSLRVVPMGMIRDGFINYTLNADGLIVYDGFVTYATCNSCPWTNTVGFSKKYKANPASLLSATYDQVGKTHSDFKLTMNVVQSKDDVNVVEVNVREMSGVSGQFEVNTDNKFIDIRYAEIVGKSYGSDLVIRLRK